MSGAFLRRFRWGLTAGIAATLPYAGEAQAAVFTGSAQATAIPFLDPSCAPLPRRGVIPFSDGSGTSTLGVFAYSHNVCTAGAPGGAVNGTFALDFGGSLLTGLLDGTATPHTGVAGLSDLMFTYTVTGGTGRFAGATGSFQGLGSVDTRGGPPSRLSLNYSGEIFGPGIPEPRNWILMLVGFGSAGAALRRRPRPARTVRYA